MARTTSRGRSRVNLYAEAVRIFFTDDLFGGNDAMTHDDYETPDPSTVVLDEAARERAQEFPATDPDAPDVLFDDAAREREREYDAIASEASATVTDDEMGAALDAVLGDITRVAVSIRVVTRILVEAHSAATKRAASLREAQKRTGHAIDTRADYAEGSAAAYSFALSALEGAAGSPRAILAGKGWTPPSGMAAPVLPDGVAVVIAATITDDAIISAALEILQAPDDDDDAPIP